jgi:hypothetical protein
VYARLRERPVTGAVRTWRLGLAAGAVGAAPPAVVEEVAGAEEEVAVVEEGAAPAKAVPTNTVPRKAAVARTANIEVPSSAALIARTRKTTSFVGLRG